MTALKTVSARIRGSKTDLESLGESVDGLADGFSKYAKELKAISGVDIMLPGTTDQYKDIYDIFDGISKVWDKLSDTQQARVSEILGGTRQLQVITSILTNWEDATNAYADAMDSAGVSTKANDIYMESVSAHLGQLKATFEELAHDTFTRDFLNQIIDLGKACLEAVGPIIKLVNALGMLPSALAVTGIVKFIKNIGTFKTVFGALTGAGGIGKHLADMPKHLAATAAAGGKVTSAFKGVAAALNISTTALAGFIALMIAPVVIKWVDSLVSTFDKASTAAEDAANAYEEQTQKVESINTELETMGDRIDELKQKGSLSLTEEQELANLQQQTKELESQLEFEKQLQEVRGRESAQAARELLTDSGLVYHADTHQLKEMNLGEMLKLGGSTLLGLLGESGISQYAFQSARADMTGGIDALLDEYEVLIAKRDELNAQKVDLDPKVNFDEYQRVENQLNVVNEDITEVEGSLGTWMEKLRGVRDDLVAAGVSDEYVDACDELIDRFTKASAGLTDAEVLATERQAKIDEALALPQLSDTVDTIKEVANGLNGIDDVDFEAILNDFPELARVIGEACGFSESELDGLSESFDGNLGTALVSAISTGTDDAKEIWRGFINTINSEAGTVNYTELRQSLLDAYSGLTPEGVSRDWNDWNEVQSMIADMSDEEIKMFIDLGYDIGSMTPEEVSEAIQQLRDDAEEAASSIEAAGQSVTNFESSMSALKTAMSSSGTVSYETFNSDELKDYASALEYVNGEYRYNIDAVKEITEAKREELKANIEVSKSQKQQEYLENAKEIGRLRDGLDDLADAQKKVREQRIEELISDNQDIEREIQGFDVLSAQLDNTFDKYQEWLNMKGAASQGEMFSELGEALKLVDDTLHNADSDSWMRIGEDNFESAVKFLVGDVDAAEDEIDAAFNRISRYFERSEEGAFTGKSNIAAIITDLMDDGFLDYNDALDRYELATGVTTQAIADKWGITKDAVWALFQEVNAYLKDEDKISISDEFSRSTEQLGTDVSRAIESLRAIGVLGEDFTINMDLNGYETVEEKIQAIDGNVSKLEDVLVQFEDDPTSYAIIQNAIHDLLLMKEQLQNPTTVELDTSGLTEDTAAIYDALYDIQQAYEQIQNLTALQESTGIDFSADITALQDKVTEAQGILQGYEDSETLAKLGIDPDSLDSIESAITNDGHPYNVYVQQHLVDAAGNEVTSEDPETGEQTIETTVKVNREELDAFMDEDLEKDATVNAHLNGESVSGLQGELDAQLAESGGLSATVSVTASTEGSQVDAEDGTATITYVVNDEDVDAFLARNINRSAVVSYSCVHTSVDSFLRTLGNKTYTITYRVNTVSTSTSSSKSKTTAGTTGSERLGRVLGTAYARGTWGTKESGEYLVGELGPELVVNPTTGKWYTVGDKGAQFVNLPKGSIVFNHLQTEDLLRDGSTIGRALGISRALASGNALATGGNFSQAWLDKIMQGSGGYSNSSGYNTSSSSNRVSGSTKASGDEDNWFERMYAYHNHLINMEQEEVSDYLKWLNDAYKQAYNEQIIELEDYYQYQEEVFEKLRELYQDSLDDVEHTISMLEHYQGTGPQIVAYYKSLMASIEKEIWAARAAGLNDNDEYIQELQDRWKQPHQLCS